MKPMKKTALIISVVIIAVVLLILYAKSRKAPQTVAPGVRTAASFYPLAHFTEKAGGQAVEVYNVTPAGAESHDFEPTPQDIKRLHSSRLFIYNGGGFDPWAEKVSANIKRSGVKTLDMSSRFTLLSGGDREKGGTDPHIWLDPLLAIKEVEIIRDALIETAPEKAGEFTDNSNNYINELRSLQKSYEDALSACLKREIVVSHNAFSYLAKRYNINVTSIAGTSVHEEPSPRRIGEIAKSARARGIEYIFFETLVSPKIAQTVAAEAGAKTLVLNPIEGLTQKEIEAGRDYISVMKENLDNLRIALSCK